MRQSGFEEHTIGTVLGINKGIVAPYPSQLANTFVSLLISNKNKKSYEKSLRYIKLTS